MSNERWWHGKKGEWYVVVQLVLFVLIAVSGWFWNVPIVPAQEEGEGIVVLHIIGGLLGLFGIVIAGYGIHSLGDNLTAVPHPKETGRLVATGAYRLVRHPIYSGAIFGSVGWGLFGNSWLTLLLALGLLIFFDVKSRREEFWLQQKYADYDAYRQQVRKLIPFIY